MQSLRARVGDPLSHDGPRAEWRLLPFRVHDGVTNMAIDEAILAAVAERRSPATIRFYGWDPPAVSIGYAQSMRQEIDLEACLSRGYTWVRRLTGGRAVLHIDELTYSVTAPDDEPRVAGDIVTSYQRLSRGLMAGLRRLGCDAVQATEQSGSEQLTVSAACFDVPSHYEVTALGRKLIGSAQVRRRGVVLQHGALPLRGQVTRLAEVLRLSEEERGRVRAALQARAVTLEEVLDRPIGARQVARALAAGFAETLNVSLTEGDLASYELAAATRLQVRYAGDEWTFCR